MAVDAERWWRLLEHVLRFYPETIDGEREAVLHFSALHDLVVAEQERST